MAKGKSLVAARNQQWVIPMDSERWRQIYQLLEAAMDREPEERAAFLAAACADDESLRLEVESLLRSDEAAESFIEKPVVERVAELIAERHVHALLLSGREGDALSVAGTPRTTSAASFPLVATSMMSAPSPIRAFRKNIENP